MEITVIEGIRQVLGEPTFYDAVTNTCDKAGMIEYITGAAILCIVVYSVFRLIAKAVS